MPNEISDYQKHLRAVDIPAWEYRSGDWYAIQLFDLMRKADENNKFLLGSVYPEEMAAYMWWYNGKPEEG